ncbi:sodium/glucose cotransporter 4-like [Amphiura filiformis]|uniref:sodium/glucose cotransporter 4-like n=1 Tax=Amphiura filiformis TaxID=82378 RepID=UPI003B21DC51
MAVVVGELTVADLTLVVIYLILVLAVGILSLFRPSRGGSQGYFLASSTVPWYQVGASVFASNIGSQHFIGIAGTAAASGYAVALYEWLAIFSIVPLMYIFLPVYFSSAIFTMPEYLGKRFGGKRVRTFIAVFSLVYYILTKISVDLFAGAVFIETILKWKLYPAVGVLLLITALYTMAGGLAAVVYTETLQTFVMIAGSVTLTIIGFNEIGGYGNLGEAFLDAKYVNASSVNDSIPIDSPCRSPPSNSLHLFRGVGDELTALGFFTGQYFAATYYWATDQVQVQRVLAAKNLAHGQGGLIMATWLKLTPMFLMAMPGMISRILYTDEVACVGAEACRRVCDNPDGCTNIAYPLMVVRLLPNGLRGILTAVMLSALMSSLASAFNSASTIFTLDIWTKIRDIPTHDHITRHLSHEQLRKNERELMIVGRGFVILMLIASILWIPIVEQGGNNGQLFTYINSISNVMTSPIFAVFLLAVLWPKTTEKGAFWSLIICFILSFIRTILDYTYPNPKCIELDTRPPFIQAIMIHYMYFSAINFFIAVVIIVGISFCTSPIPENGLYRLTWWSRNSTEKRVSPEVIKADRHPEQYQRMDSDQTQETKFSNESNENLHLVDKNAPKLNTVVRQLRRRLHHHRWIRIKAQPHHQNGRNFAIGF